MTLSIMQLVCDHPLSPNRANDSNATPESDLDPSPNPDPSLQPSTSLYHTILAKYLHASHQSSTPTPSQSRQGLTAGQALDMAIYICQIPPCDRGADEHAFLERVSAVVSLDLYKRPGGHAPAACGELYSGEMKIPVEVEVNVYRVRSAPGSNGSGGGDAGDAAVPPKDHWDVTVHWPKPESERICLCKRDQPCACDQLRWTSYQAIGFRNDRCRLASAPDSDHDDPERRELVSSCTFTADLHDAQARTHFIYYGHTDIMRNKLDDAERKAINVASLPSQKAGDASACLYHRALERFLASCCCNLDSKDYILTSGGLVSRREDFDKIWSDTVEGRRRVQPEVSELTRFSYVPVDSTIVTTSGPSKARLTKQ